VGVVSRARRILIVNADDFGHSAAVNEGVIEAHERGIVTSASLMVRRPSAADAAAYDGRLALGLHAELGELPPEEVRAEIAAQLDAFRELVGREPTHLDSHRHVHRTEPARGALAQLAGELGIPLRHLHPAIRYLGDFYGRTDTGEALPSAITVDALVGLLRRLGNGVTELGCHPAKGRVEGSSYAAERQRELAALCDPRVRETLEAEGVELRSFADLP
jgi:predicted glycoside hydrolase/deacetylase ChbG (UPF0249 family)